MTRSRLTVDIKGGIVSLQAEYNPALLGRLRRLPDRRYDARRRRWTAPARRLVLAELSELLDELEGSVDAVFSRRAQRRMDRQGPGSITLAGNEFRLSFGYNPRRVELVRAIAERRYDPAAKTWTVPATRLGAVGLLELVAAREFRAPPQVRQRLESLVRKRDGEVIEGVRESSGSPRESPIPHTRRVTRGPIYKANPGLRRWVKGVWCVPVRVRPNARGHRSRRRSARNSRRRQRTR